MRLGGLKSEWPSFSPANGSPETSKGDGLKASEGGNGKAIQGLKLLLLCRPLKEKNIYIFY